MPIPLRAALPLAAIVAAPLYAQTSHGTVTTGSSVDSLQTALNAFLNATSSTPIHNWREGSAGKGKWDMIRRLSSAETVRRCYTRLNAPTVISNSGIAASDIARQYDIDWALIGTVTSNGSRVKFTAAHMTSDEYGEITFATPDEAETVRDTFVALRDKCKT